ncbi:hypothetical protein QYE76_022461 [Lolium multiflorum]|uniref:Retrotransposon Copia-like N-terminal domain-containing protein n=1 Tax=Lolium multiflorum TaxID=4521 RepID=A0AAD8RBK3_LOLMU|nr:hypothetical protein QYE76_022461 [Lolium multiflorum]
MDLDGPKIQQPPPPPSIAGGSWRRSRRHTSRDAALDEEHAEAGEEELLNPFSPFLSHASATLPNNPMALNTAPPPASFPASVIQTVAIRSHVPVTLDLAAGNYAQWRRFLLTVIGKFGLSDHIDPDAARRVDDPEWVMIDHAVVHWLYITVSPELLDVVMQPEDTAVTVWAAIASIFRDNQLSRAVYIDAEYQLRDLGQPVTETQQVFNLIRGLGRQYHAAIPHITSRVPLPSFLQVRSFLMLEEHRAEQASRQQAAHTLYTNRAPAPIPAPAPVALAQYGAPSSNGANRNKGRGKKGKGKAVDTGGGSPSAPPPAAPAARSPAAYPAPAAGANSWTGLVQAWPVAWRAPGAGVLGPRPGTPHQQAYMAAPQYMAAPHAPSSPYGYAAPPAGYGAPLFHGAGTPGA